MAQKELQLQLSLFYSLSFTGIPITILAIVKKWLLAGLSLNQILLLQAIFSISIMLFEIPTGTISDTFKRKTVLLFYILSVITGLTVYWVADSFWLFALAEVIIGFSATLQSGTATAFAYESLLEAEQKGQVKQVFGKRRSLIFVWQTIAFLLSGWLTSINLSLPFIIGLTIYLPSLCLIIIVKEPKRQKAKTMHTAISKAIVSIVTKWSVLFYLFLVLMFNIVSRVYYWTIQVQLFTVMSATIIGLFLAATNLSSALGSWISPRLEGKRALQFSLVILYLSSAFLIYTSVMTFILFWFLMQFCNGMLLPFFSAEMQEDVSSEERATVVSLISTIMNLTYSSYGIIIGWLALSDTAILQNSLLLGVFFGLSGLLVLSKKYSMTKEKERNRRGDENANDQSHT